MDILAYYFKNRCASIFKLKKTSEIMSLGSGYNNDYIIKDNYIIPEVYFKIKYENNNYFILIEEGNIYYEGVKLPTNKWIKLLPGKELLVEKDNKEKGYFIFRKKEGKGKTRQKAKRKTLEIQQIPPSLNVDNKIDISNNIEKEKEENLLNIPVSLQNTLEKDSEIENIDDIDYSLSKLSVGSPEDEEEVFPKSEIKETQLLPPKEDEFEKVTVIDERYEILSILGKGGMGIVYKVRDKKIGNILALKLLLYTQSLSHEAIQRFINEARAIARLRHPNIVGVHYIGKYKGNPYFTMDFIEGEELSKIIKKGIKIRQILKWMVEICNAIDYIHKNGIIHRDLKPSNIIINKDKKPILMDFGIARVEKKKTDSLIAENLTLEGQSLGTPAYMSPEQARGLVKDIDERTDIYGLGAIFYEMLTGNPPFKGTPLQVLYKVCSVEPEPIKKYRPNVPDDIITIVERAMAKEKEQRYSSAKEMAEDIERFMEGFKIKAKPIPLYLKVWSSIKRNKRINYTIIGSIFLVIFILLFISYKNYQSKLKFKRKIESILNLAQKEEEKIKEKKNVTLAKYIKILKLYTDVLLLDPNNQEALKGKFKISMEIGDKAISLQNYIFARAMYNNALETNINKIEVLKALQRLEKIEKERNKRVIELAKNIFKKLKKYKIKNNKK